MQNVKESYGVSKGWYLLGGAALGAVIALLYAPKSGEELREDIADWRRRNISDNGGFVAWAKGMFSKAEEELPVKVRSHGPLHEARELAGSSRR
jgi:hypothetical protein